MKHGRTCVPSDNPSQPSLRIATYNVEWFNNLFGRNDVLMADDKWSSRYKVKRRDQLKAIADVMKAVNADAMMIIEAPDTGGDRNSVRALQNFAEAYGLRQSHALSGFESHTRQEITLMYDPDVVGVRHDPRGSRSNGQSPQRAPRFDSKFMYDLGVEGHSAVHVFSKPPLEVALTHKASGKSLNLIGVHNKSKALHERLHEDVMVKLAIANRNKQLGQCVWIRQRVEDHIAANEPVIVLGDFNDGPKMDAYEALFKKSSIEIVMGGRGETYMDDPYASVFLDPMSGWALSSARFYNAALKWYVNTLLDYIMVSPDLAMQTTARRIFHPFDDPQCYASDPMKHALLTASDHFPVCIDLAL
ncbi:MAG TPA: endonuclease [Rhodobacteraceae bacterium]|nr:endonuclease [Paracoccaceae bacterium]